LFAYGPVATWAVFGFVECFKNDIVAMGAEVKVATHKSVNGAVAGSKEGDYNNHPKTKFPEKYPTII